MINIVGNFSLQMIEYSPSKLVEVPLPLSFIITVAPINVSLESHQ
jgi:hypothetical protein